MKATIKWFKNRHKHDWLVHYRDGGYFKSCIRCGKREPATLATAISEFKLACSNLSDAISKAIKKY